MTEAQAITAMADCKNRNEAAGFYAYLLRQWPASSGHWSTLNRAIMQRWSPAALIYIKEKAWKQVTS